MEETLTQYYDEEMPRPEVRNTGVLYEQYMYSFYRDRGINAATEYKQVELLSVPDGVYTIKAEIVNPQKDLSTDDETLKLSLGRQAMIYGTWALCISERGEDGGQLMDEVTQKYAFHLQTAIELDRRSYPNEGDVEVV